MNNFTTDKKFFYAVRVYNKSTTGIDDPSRGMDSHLPRLLTNQKTRIW